MAISKSAPRLLDLFCGAGGCTKGYQDAGFYVVGVDIKPQPNYVGDEFIQDDALDYLRDFYFERTFPPFVAIHASPPCPRYSSITEVTGTPEDHPDLIAPVRSLLEEFGLPYVIENVPRSPLRAPVTICAAGLGLSIVEDGTRYVLRRHRLFETNFPIMVPPCACWRGDGTTLGIYGGGTRQDTRKEANPSGGNTQKANRAQAWALMETPWMTRQEMTQAIPPAYTELVGGYLMRHLETKVAA